MSWFDRIKSGVLGKPGSAASALRQEEWRKALEQNRLPPFVETRLASAAQGKVPWLSTMTPAELLLVTKHKIRPVAIVSGTCCYDYAGSWSQGHVAGLHEAIRRMRREAIAAGANAVVDVEMKHNQIDLEIEEGIGLTVCGTAVHIDRLPPSDDPVIATVPALEFVRLLIAGIVPVGIAIGAHDEWCFRKYPISTTASGKALRVQLDEFWEKIRGRAIDELTKDAQRLGDGVLAHTHFGRLYQSIRSSDLSINYLARHIVVGTVIHTRRSSMNVSPTLQSVVDMKDDTSPLRRSSPRGYNAYPIAERMTQYEHNR
jgi:hypothetical protein